MTEKLLLEYEGSRIALPEKSGDKYKIRIIGWEPGAEYAEGSSGMYPVDMLKRDVPESFPKGTRQKANHDGLCEMGGDVRRIMAKTVDTPWAEADGMYTWSKPSEQWKYVLEDYADVIGVSISAAGEYATHEATPAEIESGVAEEGEQVITRHEETGKPIIAKLFSMQESPYNSIDFVEAPGADGRIVDRVLESARAHMPDLNVREQMSFLKGTIAKEDSEAVPPRNNKEENSMDEAEVKRIAAEAASEAAKAAVLEALKPAEPTEDATNIETVAEAMIEAGLSKESREAVYERINRGEKVAEAIAKEKAREDAIEARVAEKLSAKKSDEPEGFGYTAEEGFGGSGSVSIDEEYEREMEGFVS